MSDAVSLEFIGHRLDSIQADTADIRRRLTELAARYGDIESRRSGIESRISGVERRQGVLEERMDALVERQSGLEIANARTLLLVERIAAKVGVDDE